MDSGSADEQGCAASLGFDGFADAVEPTTNTTEAIDRLRRAWKNTLAREGKLFDPEGSRPDLVERPQGNEGESPE